MTPEQLADELGRLHEESYGWALSCCGWREAMAEDILQTAYMRIVSGRARFGGRSSFRTWLFGVIRRVGLEELRRQRRRDDREIGMDAASVARPSDAPSPLERVTRSDRSRRLIRLLGRLPDRQREVLHLVFYEEMTIAEAAEVMGTSLGTARTHYARGKEKMRELIEQEQEMGIHD